MAAAKPKCEELVKAEYAAAGAGAGGTASVALVPGMAPDGGPAAVKFVDRVEGQSALDQAATEVCMLRELNAAGVDGVPTLFEACRDNTVIAISPFMGGELFDRPFLGPNGETPEEPVVWHVLYSLVRSLAGIHGTGVAHNDIKGENIMFRDKARFLAEVQRGQPLEVALRSIDPAMIDFGMSCGLKCPDARCPFVNTSGTYDYFAPETHPFKATDPYNNPEMHAKIRAMFPGRPLPEPGSAEATGQNVYPVVRHLPEARQFLDERLADVYEHVIAAGHTDAAVSLFMAQQKDVWALGVALLEWIRGFGWDRDDELTFDEFSFNARLTHGLRLRDWQRTAKWAMVRAVLERMLTTDPLARATSAQLWESVQYFNTLRDYAK